MATAVHGAELDDYCCLAALDTSTPPGEVQWSEVELAFSVSLPALSERAATTARQKLEALLQRRRESREATAAVLRDDAERYRTDRLAELDREQKAAETPEEKLSQDAAQKLLFGARDVTGFKARRAAVDTFANRRREEIAAFVAGGPPQSLHPLGVIFIFPDK